MEKSEKVLLLSSIVLIGFVIAVIFHYVLGFYLNSGYPNNTFLFIPTYAFSDFFDLLPRIKEFAPYIPPATWQNYFPLAYLVLIPFAYIHSKVLSYFIFVSIFLTSLIFFNIKNFSCEKLNKLENFKNIFILTFLSYPVLYLVDRGNFDMIVFLFFIGFVCFLQMKKYKHAAFFLGIINAFKPFSLLFLIMFLFEKKYKEFFLSIATSCLLFFGGFWVFKGHIFNQIYIMIQSLQWMQKYYILGPTGGFSNSSSLFMCLKLLFCNPVLKVPTLLVSQIYNYIWGFATLLTVIFSYREKMFWKRILFLTLYMLTIPPIVFDYKLIFLFVPIWLFVNLKEKSRLDVVYVILFGLMLIPKRYFLIWIFGHEPKLFVGSVLINPIIMIILMCLIIYEQFKNDKVEEE